MGRRSHELRTRRTLDLWAVCVPLWALQACGEDPGDDSIRVREVPVSVSFQDGLAPGSGYAGSRDTMLDGQSPTSKNGSATSLSVEASSKRVALLSWDLAGSIPATAVVEAVSLKVEVSDRSPEVFSLYEAKRAWSEGQATWNEYAAGNGWQVGGARGTGDRGSTALGSFSAPNTGPVTIDLNAAGVAVVQGWVEDPATNHGIVVDGPGTSNRLEFRASEYGTKSRRPMLTVTWHEDLGEPGEISLDPTPGTYKQTCDGSFGVALDGAYFVDGNDEDQGLRIYKRGASANAAKVVDISASLGLSSSDEVDLEDAARIDDRIYAVSSHGRDKSGNLERMRYRFLAVDVSGTAPNVSFAAAGYTTTLLDEMLKSANWLSPDAGVIATLSAAANLAKATDANLAPKVGGTNIEGLAWLPREGRPRQLVLGFRNPMQGASAILVTLLNADAVLTGLKPQFGEAILLDLGGLRVRGMSWSPLHGAVLIIAGPKDAGGPGPFRLYKWSGAAADAPLLVQDLAGYPSDSGPEAVVVYPNTHDVQILHDQGEHLIGGASCKDGSSASQFFTDVIVHVP